MSSGRESVSGHWKLSVTGTRFAWAWGRADRTTGVGFGKFGVHRVYISLTVYFKVTTFFCDTHDITLYREYRIRLR